MNRDHEDLVEAVSTLTRTTTMSVADATAALDAFAASTTSAAHQLGEWQATAHSAGDGGPAILTDADRARRRARAKRERAARRSNRR